MLDQSFLQLFRTEIKRRLFEESQVRLERCLNELSEADIWWRPNENSNSAGNLVLHLCGNARQWILAGLGGALDQRRRQAEFDERGPILRAELIQKVGEVMSEIDEVLDRLKPEDLERPILVQGFDETGLSILIHVVEHFSYHVGQMAYIVKARLDKQTNFYGGINLENNDTH
ncbi:MAG: DinB family protein [Haliscomenobacter sp.]|uniref:DinB family protein n=1 Tax=Haliscomenobacter sp. TaxID=2717303 RepID=UPI0029BEB6EC|nr:DinB family protein [Haliscomenobacter sp.]MDX2072020.1 DinB family protein [Haliscomenobacter sp.]